MTHLHTRLASALALGLVLSVLASSASAGLMALAPTTLADLGSDPLPYGSLQTTVANYGNLYTDMLSQVYTDGDGGYIYLYQVKNTGGDGNSPVELFHAVAVLRRHPDGMGDRHASGRLPRAAVARP